MISTIKKVQGECPKTHNMETVNIVAIPAPTFENPNATARGALYSCDIAEANGCDKVHCPVRDNGTMIS